MRCRIKIEIIISW